MRKFFYFSLLAIIIASCTPDFREESFKQSRFHLI